MSNEEEKIVKTEIDETDVVLFTTRGFAGPYSTSLFLCEIYEKLNNRFVHDLPENEFFNYTDPKGAWTLLTDFFEKSNYLYNTTLKDFEEYRSRYDVSLDYKRGVNSDKYKAASSFSMFLAFNRFERELDKWRILDKESIDSSEYNPNVFRYYSCKTMIDFVFGLVHYYVFNEYRIVKCKHCGKLFATNQKEDYCSRKSPFAGYEDRTCKKAVKAIKDMLEKRRKSEYERLRLRANEYGVNSNHYTQFNTFNNICNEYKGKIKKGASVELLEEYRTFLYDSAGTRPKYERIKNW